MKKILMLIAVLLLFTCLAFAVQVNVTESPPEYVISAALPNIAEVVEYKSIAINYNHEAVIQEENYLILVPIETTDCLNYTMVLNNLRETESITIYGFG